MTNISDKVMFPWGSYVRYFNCSHIFNHCSKKKIQICVSLWNVTINYGGIKTLFFTFICPFSHYLPSFFKTVASLFSSIEKISETRHRTGQTFEPSSPTQLCGTSDGPRGRKVTSLGYCCGYGPNKYSAWPAATPPSPGGLVCVCV